MIDPAKCPGCEGAKLKHWGNCADINPSGEPALANLRALIGKQQREIERLRASSEEAPRR